MPPGNYVLPQDPAADVPGRSQPVDVERRSRGTSAGLDLAGILAVARTLDPERLTMQAVADRMGVHRKAINHHVGNRATLLELVALDVLATGVAGIEIDAGSDWEAACGVYARGMVEALTALGAHGAHLPPGDPGFATFLAPTERLAQVMAEVGFDPEQIKRGLALLSNICVAHARDARGAVHGRPAQLRQALAARDPADYHHLRIIATLPVDTYGGEQLTFAVAVFVQGMRALLPVTDAAP